MKKILIFRFSAMGDVALLVPVIKSFVSAYPDVQVTIVTRPKFGPMFFDMERVNVFPADVDNTYTGVLGMRDLFGKLLRKGPYDVVIDMHDHIRTIVLRSLFRIFGSRVVVFNKGRKEKKMLTQAQNKTLIQLPHAVERYRQAFELAGYPFKMVTGPYLALSESIQNASEWFGYKKAASDSVWIGIAPFAMHKTKIWPLENYPLLMQKLIDQFPVKFFLFGGGEKEIRYFDSLKEKFPTHTEVIAGQLKLRQEISLMKHLDLMLCVDSSNMHMAALSGVPVLSIWGGTHPAVGFGPYGADANSILQIDQAELPCRPCSVYGKEKCLRDDFACLTQLTPDLVAKSMLAKLKI